VQIYYDPKVISFETLAHAFFFAHDPTELNRQGPDEGTDYRSIAFYRTPEEKAILLDEIKKVEATKHYDAPIVTQVVPFKVFYPAEKYHQGYYRLHLGENPYLTAVSEPKVMKFRKVMKANLMPEFQK
jgi:peptide-methionine (S)-S-oxide reductase